MRNVILCLTSILASVALGACGLEANGIPASPAVAPPVDASSSLSQAARDASGFDAAISGNETTDGRGTPPSGASPPDAERAPVDALATAFEVSAAETAPDAGVPPPPSESESACSPADPALALCLRFEGQVVDESSRGQRLSASGVAYDTGPAGMAGRLGAASTIKVPESPSLDSPQVTIEAWLAPRTLPAAGRRQGILDNSGQYGMFLLPPATVMCIAGDVEATAVGVLTIGAWISAACTFDGRAVTVWIEGKKVAERPSMAVNQGGGAGLTVGLNNPSGENFEGLLDNVRVWRTVRTPDELCRSALACR
jgi:hypothetical protein